MKKYISKIVVFLIPVVVYFGLVAISDPYNFFPTSNLVSQDGNKNVAAQVNEPLFKLLGYEKKPNKNIILGDSRSNILNVAIITKCAKIEFAKMSYGGGTLQEVISTFWEAVQITELEKVAMGMNFDLYNEAFNMNRVSEAITLKDNYISYAASKYVFKSNFINLKNKISNKPSTRGVPDMTYQEFWDYQLNSSANNKYRIYLYPKNYFSELKKIKKYCDQNGIELVFFIPPTHVDLQQKIAEFKLETQQAKFLEDLHSLGVVFDFDFPNELTQNKENFKDPYHCNAAISKIVAETVFCKISSNEFQNYFKYQE